MADATHIKVHERRSRRRVVAHTSALQTQAGVPQRVQRRARHVEIHRLTERMLAELRHTSAAPSQHRVGCWRAVSTNHMDGFVPDLARYLPDHVEQTRIHVNLFVLAPVAKEPVKFLERLLVVPAVTLVSYRNIFVSVNVVKGERAGVAVRDRAVEGVITEQYDQCYKSRARTYPRRKSRSEKLICRVCRHSQSHLFCTSKQVGRPHQPTHRRQHRRRLRRLNFTGIRVRRDGRLPNFPNHTNALVFVEYGKKKPTG